MIVYSLKLKRYEFQVLTQEGTVETWYVEQLNGKGRDTYMQALGTKLVVDPVSKKATVKSYDGFQLQLLALCVHDAKGELVPLARLETFPAPMLDDLFEEAGKLSGLTEEEKVDLGNGSPANG